MEQAISPADYPTVIPYLINQDAPSLIEFVKQTFGAIEHMRTIGNAGGVHCEVIISNSVIMIGGGRGDDRWKGEAATAALFLYIDDVQGAYQRAIQANATSLLEPINVPQRGLSADFKDPFGNTWFLSARQHETS
ncbi:hypothetical protein KDH_02830 [Dictyobacter sp. S3.2.2.5]|uniref:VOC domain-containing protein n=1 Tax=Dictyobacter halimunensis TaxID=3026934 RepID=A0ABQ6FHB7_9CHLR|nr:hypothetical protein KDH_02830 [Dictyobacter sp. S3.2.2.5]